LKKLQCITFVKESQIEDLIHKNFHLKNENAEISKKVGEQF